MLYRPLRPAGFDPATLNLTGWWRASYGGSPWTPTASAGLSGSNGNLAEATNPPAVGAAVNGYTPADCDGVDDKLDAAADFSALVTGAAGTVIVLFNADTAAAAAPNAYNDPSLVSDSINAFNLGFSANGLGVAFYDGSWIMPAKVACATGGLHMAFCRWGSGSLEHGIDAGALQNNGAGSLRTAATYKLRVGAVAISSPAFFDGKIMEVMVASTALTDTDRANIRSYFNARYGLSL